MQIDQVFGMQICSALQDVCGTCYTLLEMFIVAHSLTCIECRITAILVTGVSCFGPSR